MSLRTRALIVVAATATLVLPGSADAARQAPYKAIKRGLQSLVDAPAGPPGAIATIHRGGRTRVISVGRADVSRRGRPRANQHMPIASVSKAFSGAVVLNLVRKGRLDLDDTIGERLPSMPAAWHAVTIRQLLNHTSGVPSYTSSDAFLEQIGRDPNRFIRPTHLIDFVRSEPLGFPPGSAYKYSNTDNIVLALSAEGVTGDSYRNLLTRIVFRPTRLTDTSYNMRRLTLPRPFLHGYVTVPGEEPRDVTTSFSMSGAGASGGIVSTPLDLGRFFRAYLRGDYFGPAQKRAQRRFVLGGASDPRGPGANSAGLALFRYRTRCGTVYGHTGSFLGYAQWAAATADGRRSATTTLNIPPPEGALLARLRRVQTSVVCALLRK
jgi:D-alanyl-D-alanine carboxypeptidase